MLAFLYPLFWPFLNLFRMVTSSAKPFKNVAKDTLGLFDHLISVASSWRSSMFAYFCMFVLYTGQDYPAFGRAKTFQLDWMWPLMARNLIGTMLLCGLWDWILYFSPLKDRLHDFKMNPVYPSIAQVKHDAFYTMVSSAIASIMEILLCYGWANGQLAMETSLMNRPVLNFIMLSTIIYWRVCHFHLIHRGMHPWRTERIPDLGKIAYRYIHSLHHKSYNPTAFSGTSMHPIESTLYYTACFIPVAFGLHPLIALAGIMDLATGAWFGHDGFQWPGSCDYFHYLHHKHFDCNYSGPQIPLDKLFGTFASSKEDLRKNWQTNRVGSDFNETPVHELDEEKARKK